MLWSFALDNIQMIYIAINITYVLLLKQMRSRFYFKNDYADFLQTTYIHTSTIKNYEM